MIFIVRNVRAIGLYISAGENTDVMNVDIYLSQPILDKKQRRITIMNKDRIQELADFFYSSNDSNIVPLRIAVETGQYAGSDLSKNDFISLMKILNSSKNLKKDLILFLEKL